MTDEELRKFIHAAEALFVLLSLASFYKKDTAFGILVLALALYLEKIIALGIRAVTANAYDLNMVSFFNSYSVKREGERCAQEIEAHPSGLSQASDLVSAAIEKTVTKLDDGIKHCVARLR